MSTKKTEIILPRVYVRFIESLQLPFVVIRLILTLKWNFSLRSASRCVNGVQVRPPPATADCNSDLQHWNHSYVTKHIPDEVLRRVWEASGASFVFHQVSHIEQRKTVWGEGRRRQFPFCLFYCDFRPCFLFFLNYFVIKIISFLRVLRLVSNCAASLVTVRLSTRTQSSVVV